MKVSVLASGSKGNCTYVCAGDYKLLVDLGTSCFYVEKELKAMGISPWEINSIFITHTHSDHIGGLKTFYKKYKPLIYLSKIMHEELGQEIELDNYIYIDDDFKIDDLVVNIIKTSHDTGCSKGYIFEYENKSLVYITDTGYINEKYHERLKNKTMYIMESNHDIDLLMKTNRPHFLKIRILGDEGHLSNNDASLYLADFIGKQTKCVVLAHLSEEANDVQLARETLENKLAKRNKEIANIVVAKQRERTELIEI